MRTLELAKKAASRLREVASDKLDTAQKLKSFLIKELPGSKNSPNVEQNPYSSTFTTGVILSNPSVVQHVVETFKERGWGIFEGHTYEKSPKVRYEVTHPTIPALRFNVVVGSKYLTIHGPKKAKPITQPTYD